MILNIKSSEIIIEIISLLFILLFGYAAVSKILDYGKFVIQISQSPMLTGIADLVAWGVPAFEIIVSLLLMFSTTRLFGLYASFSLMVMFTTYILIILNFSDHVPCSCGGVLEKLGWTEHLIFNMGFLILGLTGIVLSHVQIAKSQKTENQEKKFIAQ